MIKGLYTSAMGMLIQEAEQNVVTNNLANTGTNGYKKDRITFEEFPHYLEMRLNDTKLAPGQKFYNPPHIGYLGTGVILDRVTTEHEEGPLRETENPTDLALGNKAYFMVQTPQGLRYTRDGQFQINADGLLVTRQGYRVMGTQGDAPAHLQKMVSFGEEVPPFLQPIQITADTKFIISEAGKVINDGVDSGFKIMKVDFADTNQIEKEGYNYFKLIKGDALYDGVAPIKQGFLEQSNVNVVNEMVHMIRLSRAYEANAKVLQGIDERLGQAVREVGQVRG